jgi:hypothetical protein
MTDDENDLERDLRSAAEAFDPVPADLIRFATATFDMRELDTELAELVFDSLAEDQAALVRTAVPPRLVAFHARELSIEAEMSGEAPTRRLVGRLVPPEHTAAELPLTVDVQCGGAVVTAALDELGRFAVDVTALGPWRLRLTPPGPDRRPIVTAWVAT